MDQFEGPKIFGTIRGIVQTLELKSGLNPLLFLDAIFGIPALSLYALKQDSTFIWFAGIPLVTTLICSLFERERRRSTLISLSW
jgi:hypothetical protein